MYNSLCGFLSCITVEKSQAEEFKSWDPCVQLFPIPNMARLHNLSMSQLRLTNRLWLEHGIYLLLVCTTQMKLKSWRFVGTEESEFQSIPLLLFYLVLELVQNNKCCGPVKNTAWLCSKDQGLSFQWVLLSIGASHPTWTRHIQDPWRESWSDHLWRWSKAGRKAGEWVKSPFDAQREVVRRRLDQKLEGPSWRLHSNIYWPWEPGQATKHSIVQCRGKSTGLPDKLGNSNWRLTSCMTLVPCVTGSGSHFPHRRGYLDAFEEAISC